MLKHIPPEQAIDILMREPCHPCPEQIPLTEALDRVLAENIYARTDVPPFNKSPFDGYTFRAADVPGTLRVVGTLSAGIQGIRDIGPGEALKIFTGAPVPASADAVIRFEDVAESERGIEISKSMTPGTNVILAGEDIRSGELLIPSGTRLLPAHLGMLAGQGIAQVNAYRKPKAVLIPTGSELSEPGESCPEYGIYNSSSYVISAYLRRMGLRVCRYPIVSDEQDAVRSAVEEALATDAEIVFTTGGASVGDFDFAMRTAKAIGAETLFWKIRMKPGGALLVSRVGDRLLVGLSGNPAAALMSILVVLRPWLAHVIGAGDRASEILLPLKNDMPKTSSATRLLRGHLDFTDGVVSFAEHPGRGNGNIASFADCELIGIIPGNAGPLRKGDLIRALRLPAELC